MTEPHLSERQAKWFASVRANLETDTGKSMAEWVAIARTCPETAHRARLNWFKAEHGLAQNRASLVLTEAFETGMGWSEPDALIEALWKDGDSRAILEAVRVRAMALPEVVMGARKGYTAFSRKVQFCALKPAKGQVQLGLAVPVDANPRLVGRAKSESWADRLTANLILSHADQVDVEVEGLLKAAWEAC